MTLKASDISTGDSFEEVLVEDLTRTQLVMYAGASGDYNPLHSDDLYSREAAGYPGVFAHGMLTMGMTGRAVTNLVGAVNLKKIGVRFTNQVWPGDTLRGTAEITSLREEDGEHYADISVVTVNQDDVPVVTGTATARLDP